MDIETARARCRELAKGQVLRFHARNALRREGYDEATIEEVTADYQQLVDSHRRGERRLTRIASAALFLGCSSLFVYRAFFASTEWHYFELWLVPPAMFGLLKMLLP